VNINATARLPDPWSSIGERTPDARGVPALFTFGERCERFACPQQNPGVFVMNIRHIPLQHLIVSSSNVRQTHAKVGIEELAASIKAHGLLQNLQVRPTTGDKFEVVAGGRRMAALKLLVKQKALKSDAEIPCNVLDTENDTEISLAENEMRLAMHPADQFTAFKRLIDEGQGIDDIAARFGVTPVIVRQRLKLASVSPKLVTLYKKGEMNLEQLMAFTVSDDHAAQEAAWNDAADWSRDPSDIRERLTSAHVNAQDRRARFTGLDAYKEAGGGVVSDLFQSEIYLTDPALLEKLFAEKLEAEAERIRAEGWKWVQVVREFSYSALEGYGRQNGKSQKLTAKRQEELKGLERERDELQDEIEREEESNPDNAYRLGQRVDEIEAAIAAVGETTWTWSDRQKAQGGAVVSVGYRGELQVTRGLVAPADIKKAKTKGDDEAQEPILPSGLSAKLRDELAAHQTIALRPVLAERANVALALVVHTLALPVFYLDGLGAGSFVGHNETVLDIRPVSPLLRGEGLADSKAAQALEALQASWLQRLPEVPDGGNSPDVLWSWLMQQEPDTLLSLLAYCAAVTIKPDKNRAFVRCSLESAVSFDMTQWWQPTAAGYLGRVSKDQILEAVTETLGAPAAANIAKLKKSEMAAKAEEMLKGKGFLPSAIRPVEISG
jgi:ParB family chromosome partitioning protein